jgi:hypothetical protein
MFGVAALACSSASSTGGGAGDASSSDSPADVSTEDARVADGSPADAPAGDSTIDAPVVDVVIADRAVSDAAPSDASACGIQGVPEGDICETVCLAENLMDGGITATPCQLYCNPMTNGCFLPDGEADLLCDYSGSPDGSGEVYC